MKDTIIIDIQSREILDSRGYPTIETSVTLHGGATGVASVPSGASTGENEALELRDGNKSRYFGAGVQNAVSQVNEKIAVSLIGMDAFNQVEIDNYMIDLDGTSNKKNFGANSILSVSLATARAVAYQTNTPLYRYLGGVNAKVLPVPLINILNGGVHSDAPIDFQEFMIIPRKFNSFSEALRAGSEVFQTLKMLLRKRGLSTAVGDEGGFAPPLNGVEDALESIVMAISKAGYKPGEEIGIGLDAAASEFYDVEKKCYIFHKSDQSQRTGQQMVDYYINLCNKYPILSIEDGCAENDWESWKILSEALGRRIQLVGDDIFVTNVQFLKKGIQHHIANSLLVKVNQIGTLTETLDAISLAKENHYTSVISHRSGETEDTFIADLAVATNAGQIKTGSLCRSERIAKYNQLLRIEKQLGKNAIYRDTLSLICS